MKKTDTYDAARLRQHTHPLLRLLGRLSWLFDNAFALPGTRLRFGIDPLLSLLPGVGDTASTAVSLGTLVLAAGYGTSGKVLWRMTVNILIDYAVGLVPFVGDLLDFGFKSHSRNLELLTDHFEGRPSRPFRLGWKVWAILGLLLALVAVVVALGWMLVSWTWGQLSLLWA